MFFNKRNLFVLVILIAFLCIISFLLGVYTLRNGTLRKAYDIFFALENLDQNNLDFKSTEVDKIDTLLFLNSRKKLNKLIKIRSDKFNTLESIVTYGSQWTTERPWIKTKFTLNNEIPMKGKFKLIGMNPDHFREANNWSVRVKLSGDNYIYKYQKFNLLVPYSRGFFVDAFYNTLYHKMGGLIIPSKPIVTRLKDHYTLQLFEPFFSKELIENQGYRDGMIISEDSVDKLGKPHLKVVHPNGYMELTDEQKKIYRFYEEVYQKGKLRNFYDVKQYAFLAAVVINTGNTFHHFGGFNLNLYVNPITGNLMPFLREIEFLPHEIPSLTSYEKVKKEFYQLSKIDRNNLKQFDLYSAYLDHFSYQLNKESIDSTILNNKELKSLYYYSNQYFPWSYAFKRRIRMPLEFKNKPILPTNSVENQEIVHKKEFSNGVFNLRNIVLAVNQLTVKNATLLFSGNVTRKGKDRIRIIGDSISTIIFENSRINLSNVEFIGFGNRIKIQNRAVTSAITFYNSDLQLNNVVFRDNYSGDDLVNIFRSKFAMNNVTFQNSKYDAIDVDFSNGVIRNCEIDKSGNDGLDFGGSQVIVHNTRVNNCGDKGISVGEKSTVQIFTSSITNSEIGFGLKDESLLRIRGIKLNNNHLDLAAYAKKGLFDSSTLDVLPKEFNSFRYLIEPGVTVKNNIVYTTTKQAKNQLYGKKYGKASVR